MDLRRLIYATMASAGLLLSGCGGSNSPLDAVLPETPADDNFNGPGSKWDVSLRADSTFNFTRRPDLDSAVDLTVDGTYVRLDSGFLAFTVTDATGDDAPSNGDTAWGLEVPDFALFLKPDDSDDGRFIAMVTAGNCPTADVTANWVMVKKSSDADATESDRDYFGSFAFDAVAETAVLPGRFAIDDAFTSQGGQDLGAGTCTDGIMRVDDAAMYLTNNGGALVHTNQSDDDDSNIIFAMNQTPIVNMDTLDGNFAGLIFDESPAVDASQVMPTTMSCSLGLCTGDLLTDVESGVSSQVSFDLNLTGSLDQPDVGMITGSLVSDGNAGNVACIVNTSAGNATLATCVGQAPGDNSNMFNAIFVSTE